MDFQPVDRFTVSQYPVVVFISLLVCLFFSSNNLIALFLCLSFLCSKDITYNLGGFTNPWAPYDYKCLLQRLCSWGRGITQVKNPYFLPACWGNLSIFHVVSYRVDPEIWLPKLCQKETKEQTEPSFYFVPSSPQCQSQPWGVWSLGYGGLEVKKVSSSSWGEPWWSSQTLPAG